MTASRGVRVLARALGFEGAILDATGANFGPLSPAGGYEVGERRIREKPVSTLLFRVVGRGLKSASHGLVVGYFST